MLPRALLTSGVFLVTLFACHSPSEEAAFLATGELPTQTFNFSEAIEASATGWQTVGAVYADWRETGHLAPTEGQGVLVHLPDGQQSSNLTTPWEHGDIDLSLEFMLPKGAHSRLFLQGRYAVELIDSWGETRRSVDNCGTIGRNGPRLDACRAPGLWQRLDIKFRAPRFDEQGQKTADARFTEVTLNGSVIHWNVAVEAPTPEAPFRDEVAQGQLVFSKSDNPLAFKNITYKKYRNEPIQLRNLQYALYAGTYDGPSALADAQPVKQGEADSLSYQLKEDQEKFALDVEGTLQIPVDGEYLFTLRTAGPSWLYLDGEEATNNHRSEYMDTPGYYHATLEAGEHSFRLVYTKSVLKWVRGLSLYVEGPQVRRQPLHAHSSERHPEEPSPILVRSGGQPLVQRGFFYHGDQKKTHCVLVGLPGKINCAIDIKNGTLLAAWGGDFVDATQMWYERGEPQTARPLGNPLELSDSPTFASLSSATARWPDSVSFDDPYLQTQGYTLDTAGAPVFHYQLNGTQINDQVRPGAEARALVREIDCSFSNADADPVYCLLGEGKQVEALPDGSYGIDGKRYYLSVGSGEATVSKRSDRGKEQLVATLSPQEGATALTYTIIW